MNRRKARVRFGLPDTAGAGTTSFTGRRYVTEAWEVWTGPREGVAVDSVRLASRAPRVAPLRAPKGIPRARGC